MKTYSYLGYHIQFLKLGNLKYAVIDLNKNRIIERFKTLEKASDYIEDILGIGNYK